MGFKPGDALLRSFKTAMEGLQTQGFSRSTSGTHEDIAGMPPGRHQRRGRKAAPAEVR